LVADTARVEEIPAITPVGLAEIVTVGSGFAVTVTVALAEVLPPAPVAVA
jgi:hypothetical protein